MYKKIQFLLAMSGLIVAQGCASHCNRKVPCSVCGDKVCVLETSVVDEAELAFEVKGKDVCAPPVRFPWSKCPPKHCGRVREVCVLEETEKEHKVCEYEWSVKTVCSKCQCAH